MKNLITVILTIGCAAILILGNTEWKSKTSLQSSAQELGNKGDEEIIDVVSFDKYTINNTLLFAKNWPETAFYQLEQTLDENRPFHIHFVGSSSLGEGATSWPELVKQSLLDTYGEEVLKVSIKTYDINSRDFLEQGLERDIINTQADLILFEPFVLKDNGVVVIEDSIVNVDTIITAVKQGIPDTTVILQPPHPIVGSTWYPVQVLELEKFATTNDIHFLNHWEAWPEGSNDYITSERDTPNEQGHGVWAKYIEDLFISLP